MNLLQEFLLQAASGLIMAAWGAWRWHCWLKREDRLKPKPVQGPPRPFNHDTHEVWVSRNEVIYSGAVGYEWPCVFDHRRDGARKFVLQPPNQGGGGSKT